MRSPIVGTFYESPSPGAPAFVKTGDSIAVGQVICIVEAMKLMNEIESDYAGVIVKSYLSNGQPVRVWAVTVCHSPQLNTHGRTRKHRNSLIS